MLYVKSVEITNIKNVPTALVTFRPVMNKISGKNGAGKSTLIDSILIGLIGKKYLGNGTSAEKLITQGKQNAEIIVNLDGTDRQIKIVRKIKADGNITLEAVDSKMQILKQADLDAIFSQFTIDPLAFKLMKKADQLIMFKQIVGIDTTDLDTRYEGAYLLRTQANAVFKAQKGALDAMGTVDMVEKVDVTKLMEEMRAIDEYNNNVRSLQARIQQGEEILTQEEAKKQDLLKKLAEVEDNITKFKLGIQSLKADEMADGIMKPDAEIKAQIANADAVNNKANARDKYVEQKKKTADAEEEHIKLDQKVKAIEAEKQKMIKEAKMPIEGMELSDEDGIIINGIPFVNYNTAEQLIIACKISVFTNPELKVIVIKDGSLLDDDSMARLEEFADAEGYQIYVEIVNEQFDTIIMREGEVLDTSIDPLNEE